MGGEILVRDSWFGASLRQPLKAGRGMGKVGPEDEFRKEGTLEQRDRGLVGELLRDEGEEHNGE